MLSMDGKRDRRGPLRDPVWKEPGRVDERETRDVLGIVGEVEPGTEADFQDVSLRIPKNRGPKSLKLLSAHHPVHQERKDAMTVQSHCGAQYSKDILRRRRQILLSPRGLC